MMSNYKKVLAVAMGIGMAAAVAVPGALASTRPHTLPAGTVVTGNLKKGTVMTFKGTIDGAAITVSCKTFTAKGTTPAKPGYKVTLTGSPTITKCTDSLGGTDTVKTNTTNGKWSLSSSKAKPTTLTLTMPKAGATFVSNVLSSCVITAAPAKADAIPGAYASSTGTDTVTNGAIPTSGSGCTSTTATTSATVILTPNPGAPPF